MEVPIRSYPSTVEFNVGDTLFWEAEFSKQIPVRNNPNPILLEDFSFYTAFEISEISSPDTVDFNREIDLVSIVGEVVRGDFTQELYPLFFDETVDRYRIHFGIVLKEPGLYGAGLYVFSQSLAESNHPVVYTCGNNLRSSTTIFYRNPSTNRAAYDSLYLSSLNSDITELSTFEQFANYGGITFRVIP
jgi:hypothetical protein